MGEGWKKMEKISKEQVFHNAAQTWNRALFCRKKCGKHGKLFPATIKSTFGGLLFSKKKCKSELNFHDSSEKPIGVFSNRRSKFSWNWFSEGTFLQHYGKTILRKTLSSIRKKDIPTPSHRNIFPHKRENFSSFFLLFRAWNFSTVEKHFHFP